MVTLRLDARLLAAPLPDGLPFETVGEHELRVELPAKKSINQLLREMGISLSQAVLAVVNGHSADLDQILEAGDEVRLLPQIAGGD